MRIAYFIMAHKNEKQILHLINALYDPSNVFIIHIDKKSPSSLYENLKSMFSTFGNIHFMKRQSAVWGAWSLVDIQLNAVKQLLNYDWDFFINLSGQDFPLKSQLEIKRFLATYNRNFIQITDPEERYDISQKWKYIETSSGQLKRLNEERPLFREVFPDINLRVGSQWMILKREVCQFIVESPIADRIIPYFKNVLIPDEIYFQTMFFASPFKDDFIDDTRRFLVMEKNSEMFSSPKILLSSDYDSLIESDSLFARKFDISVDLDIIKKLEAKVL